jgi:hypothetical protein
MFIEKSHDFKKLMNIFKNDSLQKTQQHSPVSYRITYLNVPGKPTDLDSAAET